MKRARVKVVAKVKLPKSALASRKHKTKGIRKKRKARRPANVEDNGPKDVTVKETTLMNGAGAGHAVDGGAKNGSS